VGEREEGGKNNFPPLHFSAPPFWPGAVPVSWVEVPEGEEERGLSAPLSLESHITWVTFLFFFFKKEKKKVKRALRDIEAGTSFPHSAHPPPFEVKEMGREGIFFSFPFPEEKKKKTVPRAIIII